MSSKNYQKKTDVAEGIKHVEARKKKRVSEKHNFSGNSHEDFKKLDRYDNEILERMKLMTSESSVED